MEIAFLIGDLPVYAYGLCVAAATLLFGLLLNLVTKRMQLPQGTALVFLALGIPLGIVGARLLFCVVNLSAFLETYENAWLMLRFFDGGLSMAGLLGGLLLAAALTARIAKVSWGRMADAICLPLGLWIAVCRAAESFTELGAGALVEEGALTSAMPFLFLQESMGIATESRLAVFVYEAVVAALIALVMAVYWQRSHRRVDAHHPLREGDAALVFFILYGSTSILLQSMRDDGHMLLTFLRVEQLASALMVLIPAGILSRRCAKARTCSPMRLWLSWAAMVVCVAGIAVLEFSLDGRITFGEPSMLRDYLIMGMFCAALCAVPLSLRHVPHLTTVEE